MALYVASIKYFMLIIYKTRKLTTGTFFLNVTSSQLFFLCEASAKVALSNSLIPRFKVFFVIQMDDIL